jgi:hypothetical protein
MIGHLRFWVWVMGMWLCDRMPWRGGPIPWCNVWHGGIVFYPTIADEDPCWQRAGFDFTKRMAEPPEGDSAQSLSTHGGRATNRSTHTRMDEHHP